jgi:hypothetical protein
MKCSQIPRYAFFPQAIIRARYPLVVGKMGFNRIIYHCVHLNCSPQYAFVFFTENRHLENWLTQKADVKPRIGGKYELFWNPKERENDSTIGCKILIMATGKFVCFEWKGPKQFKHFMNDVNSLTQVSVLFFPTQKGTEIHLIHTGWKLTAEWEEARVWFDKAWEKALLKLQTYATQSYGAENH